jgi:phenylalanyl-tRNA synthetase beta chain
VKISLQWLGELVAWEDAPADLAARLTAAGLHVERVEEFVLAWPGVVVGRVEGCERHPDADKLTVCRVAVGGGEPVTIVCGAPNVRAGLHVLVAQPGSVLPGGQRIGVARLRGVESRGMICSAAELGLGQDSAGIIELADEPAVGLPADDLFGYRDTVLDIEVTPNRPDWLCHLGVAREVAALYGTKLNPPRVLKPASSGALGWKVEIESFADCPRYTAHGCDNVAVGPSPRWLQNRLRAVGQRPINNVVDVTNYVLFELGQPLHAFDRERLSGGVISVRRAGRKQTVTTLDDVSRQIQADDLIIADGDGPVALAGVMGLASSEVHAGTTSLLLESAFFAPQLIRSCSRRLGLVSESSYRFEREADWAMVRFAAHRALYLLQEHCGAAAIGDAVDRADPDHQNQADLPLRVHHVNRVLGTGLDVEQAADLLQSLGLKVQPLGSQIEAKTVNLMVQVPSFRRDLKEEIDLVEEIARRHGFDQGTRAAHAPALQSRRRARRDEIQRLLRVWLPALGYHEMVTSSFMTRRQLAALPLAADDVRRECLQVLNPHHGRETLLRTSLVPGFVETARRNAHAGAPLPLRLFQIGRVFWPAGERSADTDTARTSLLPEEPLLLQCGLVGGQGTGPGGLPADLLELKGLGEQLAALLREPLALRPGGAETGLEAGLQWEIRDDPDRLLGSLGRLAGPAAAAFDLEPPAALLELRLDRLAGTARPVTFREFSRYPAARRDLSLLVPPGVTFAQLAEAVREVAGEHLESVELFDFYTDQGLGEDRAAYGIRLKFRSAKGSLESATVEEAVVRCLEALRERWQVLPRTA